MNDTVTSVGSALGRSPGEAAPQAIAVDRLAVSYGDVRVLIDASLTAAAGTMTCVLGPSGCGKTTLLRAIAGFEPARAGSIRIAGRIVEDPDTRLPPEQRRVGYVPQEGALFPHLSVAANVGFAFGRSGRLARQSRARRIGELLDLVGMSELASRMPHQLSGGQQQRVSVARALASDPQIVLLDEPFAALDAALRDRLRHDIRDVLRSAGMTALLVTHDRAEALSLADQVAVMHDGAIVQTGTPRQLYSQPADAFVARFVGDVTLLDVLERSPRSLADRQVATILGPVTLAPAAASTTPSGVFHYVAVRPEQVRLTRLEGAAAIDAAPVTGVVRRVEYYGHDARVDIAVRAGDRSLDVVVRVSGAELYEPGDIVGLTIDSPVWPLPGDTSRRSQG
jgi:iron(III) transport system ATP-binding protein